MTLPPWHKEVEDFCARFNIPIDYLAATLSDPKVVPMIRGKAFEFSAREMLRSVLPEHEWKVEKPILNPQLELKDIDIEVTHLPTGKFFRVECKLAGNGGYRAHKAKKDKETQQIVPAHSTIKVKCMRSRTLGESKVAELAPKLGITTKLLAAHADSYRVADFDVVLTTIGNAFYRTSTEGEYEFKPTETELEFLELVNPGHPDHKVGAFEKMYLIEAANLSVGNKKHPITCPRKNCPDKKNCGFIPNYPLIHFPENSPTPSNGWTSIKESAAFFSALVNQPQPTEAKTIAAEQLAHQVDQSP